MCASCEAVASYIGGLPHMDVTCALLSGIPLKERLAYTRGSGANAVTEYIGGLLRVLDVTRDSDSAFGLASLRERFLCKCCSWETL